MKFYVATRLERAARAELVALHLTLAGHDVTYPWWQHGAVGREGSERLIQVSILEAQGVLTADAVIVLLPGGRGTHAELGIALGAGKPIIVFDETAEAFQLTDATCAFYWHPLVHQLRGDLGRPQDREMLVHQAVGVVEDHRAGRHGSGAYGHAAAIAARLASGPAA